MTATVEPKPNALRAAPASRAKGPVRVVAAIHVQGDTVVALIVKRNGKPEILDSQELPKAQLSAWLAKAARQHEFKDIIEIAPGGSTIARSVPIPQASDAETLSALELQAETLLPESLPSHRRAVGLLNPTSTDARTGLLTALVADHPHGSWSPPKGTRATFIAPISALAALRLEAQAAGLTDPSDDLYAFADPADGSIALIHKNGKGLVARSLVEDTSTTDAWADAVRRATQLVTNVTKSAPSLVTPEGAPASFAESIAGARANDMWLRKNALALGGALAALSTVPTVRSFAALHDKAPKIEEPLLLRASTSLSSTRTAVIAVLSAVALAIAIPWLTALARSALMQSKSESLKVQQARREELNKRSSIYQELSRTRWPMTKILAEISASTPVGVTITNLTIVPGQPIQLQGQADNPDLVAALVTNLNNSKHFFAQTKRTESRTGETTTFDIAATVTQPHASFSLPTTPEGDTPVDFDFSKTPLAERLYPGQNASNTAVEPKADKPTRTSRSSFGGSSGASTPGANRSTGSSSLPKEAPAPIADADIAALDQSGTMKEFSTRSAFLTANKKDLDSATKQRLESEVSKLKDRLRALKGGG
ncbi:MAG: PilN domain-containing protein [Phycisphaerales bacterium]